LKVCVVVTSTKPAPERGRNIEGICHVGPFTFRCAADANLLSPPVLWTILQQ
jgi:hypothetical protein